MTQLLLFIILLVILVAFGLFHTIWSTYSSDQEATLTQLLWGNKQNSNSNFSESIKEQQEHVQASKLHPLISKHNFAPNTNTNVLGLFTKCGDLIPFPQYLEQLQSSNIDKTLGFNISQLIHDISRSDYPTVTQAESYLRLLIPYVTCLPNPVQVQENPFKLSSKQEIQSLCDNATPYFKGIRQDLNNLPILIDVFAIGYEIDLVEIRIMESYDLFDNFLIIESVFGQRLIRKPLLFDANYFKRYANLDTDNKIIHFIEDDTTHGNEYVKAKYGKQTGDSWINEAIRNDAWPKFLKLIKVNDENQLSKHFNRSLDDIIVFISDLDEIPTYETVARYKYCQPDWDVMKHPIKNTPESEHVHYYRANFDNMWTHGGTLTSVFRASQLFPTQSSQRTRITDGKVKPLELINMNRCVTPFQLMVKQLLLAEEGKVRPHRDIFNQDWEGKSEWIKKYNVNHSLTYETFCEEMLRDPNMQYYWMKNAIFTTFRLGQFKAMEIKRTSEKDKLLWFAQCNKERFAYLFPSYCQLEDIDNFPMRYKCKHDQTQDVKQRCQYKNY